MFSAQHASPRARLLIARHSLKVNQPATTGNAEALMTASYTITVNSDTTRHLSLGRWTHVGSLLQREARQRRRLLAYKCMDSIHRYLSWHNRSAPENPRVAMRKTVTAWLQSDLRPAKYTNVDEVKSWSDDFAGVRPGRNIEDVEREAINRLFKKPAAWSSPLHAMREHIYAGPVPREVTAEEILYATAGREKLNFIDPITNKRVSRSEHGNYSKTTLDDPNAPQKLTPEERSKIYSDLNDYEKPARYNEPDGLQKPTPEEESKQYTDLNKYTPEIDDPGAPRELTPEEQSKLYEDLDKYDKPVTWNEPDGLQKPTPEEESKNYDDLADYEGPVRWNEPDGLQPKTPEEKSKDYKDLGKYRAFAWNEPDGLRPLTPEEKSKQYDDLNTYDGPFVAKNSIIKNYEALLNDPTVKAKPLARKVEVQSTPPQYEDLDQYGPVMWNEPDGLRVLTPEERSKEYKDLHLYAQYDNSDADTPRVHPEEASKQYKDLSGYSAFHESGAETERVHPEEASKNYKDLGAYSALEHSGPEVERIHPEEASKQYKDLRMYPGSGYEEPANTQHVHPEELTKAYGDLDKYEEASFDAVKRIHPEEATKDYQDLHRYQKATPVVEDEWLEPITADDIRHQVMQRAGISQDEHPERESARGSEAGLEISSMDESFPEASAQRIGAHSVEVNVAEASSVTESAASEEPSAYKILAYDAATQSMSVADTTSAEHGASSPQKLEDVLLKLKHPSKFLPHFKVIQAQGYDMVAGGGDVLIFRKNRAALLTAEAAELAGSWKEGSEEGTRKVATSVDKGKKKRSLGRKVVMGTVWVGGVAYAVGALGESIPRNT